MGVLELGSYVSFAFISLYSRTALLFIILFSYTKPKGEMPDYSSPIVLRNDKKTVEDFCMKIHKSLVKDFKQAVVWGSSCKHNPQRVGKDHVLADEDIVQIIKKV